MEIERKWLLASPEAAETAARAAKGPAVEIEQGYLAISDDASVRLRRAAGRLTLTVKSGRGLARGEREIELDAAGFAILWPASEGRRLRKTRRRIPLEPERHPCEPQKASPLVAELDRYEGSLAGLWTVEVEFASTEQARAFGPPGWFGAEVTDDPAYTNARLARDGLPAGATSPRPRRP